MPKCLQCKQLKYYCNSFSQLIQFFGDMFHQTAAAKVAFQGLTKCKHNNIYLIPAEYSIAQFSRMHAQAIFIPVATSADFYSEGIQLDCRKRLKREQRLGAICWLHSCRRRAGNELRQDHLLWMYQDFLGN